MANNFTSSVLEHLAFDLSRSAAALRFPTTDIITVENIQLNDIVIAVFGPKGGGKATLVNSLLSYRIGSSTEATLRCARLVSSNASNNIVLAEMPGFDSETGLWDSSTLKQVYDWLQELYKNNNKLINGAIFVDRIAPLTTPSSSQAIKLFRSLYGEFHHNCVVLVTAKWSSIPPSNLPEAQRRERALITSSWRCFLESDTPALTARFDSKNQHVAFQHATQILTMLIGQISSAATGVKLSLQKQIVDGDFPLYWTDAGKLLFTLPEVKHYNEHDTTSGELLPVVSPVPLESGKDVEISDIRDDDIVICVFGGSGIPSFIRALCPGRTNGLDIGSSTAGTQYITCVRVWIHEIEANVVFVASERRLIDDGKILAGWFASLYKSGKRLHGTLDFHTIPDTKSIVILHRALKATLTSSGCANANDSGLVIIQLDPLNTSQLQADEVRLGEYSVTFDDLHSQLGDTLGTGIYKFDLTTSRESGYRDAADIISKFLDDLKIHQAFQNNSIQSPDTDAGSADLREAGDTSASDNQCRQDAVNCDHEDTIDDSTHVVNRDDEPSAVGEETGHSQGMQEDVSVDDISDGDIIIGVFGATGAGKTSFIEALANGHSTDLTMGHDLDQGTDRLSCVRVQLPGSRSRVVLVDTPGFDGTRKTDTQILEILIDWLRSLYKKGFLLSGAIYIQSINMIRIDYGARRALNIFRAMFADSDYNRIVLVTSQWNEIHPDQWTVAEAREMSLKQSVWSIFLNNLNPASTARFTYDSNTGSAYESAISILQDVVTKLDGKTGIKLRIQQQVIDEMLAIIERTDAGRLAIYGQGDRVFGERVTLLKIKKDDIIICLFGETGVGKSTFITALAGPNVPGLSICHTLEHNVETIVAVRITIPHLDARIVLVDTPGFNQRNISDGYVLLTIVRWLKCLSRLNLHVKGVLYLQSIERPSNERGSAKTFNIFQRLFGRGTGAKQCDQLALVTTLWDNIPMDDVENRQIAEDRERSLVDNTWASYLKAAPPARLGRFDPRTQHSAYDHALEIVSKIARGHHRLPPLDLLAHKETTDRKQWQQTLLAADSFGPLDLKVLNYIKMLDKITGL